MKSFIIALVLAATTSAKTVTEMPLKSTGWDVPGNRLYGLCEGDCDETHECETGLVCFTRGAAHQGSAQQAYSNNPFQKIPGCAGRGLEDMDYCISKPQFQHFQDNKEEQMGAEWYAKWKAEHDARAAAKAKAAQDAHDKKMADAKAAAAKKAADAKAAHKKKMAAQKAAAAKVKNATAIITQEECKAVALQIGKTVGGCGYAFASGSRSYAPGCYTYGKGSPYYNCVYFGTWGTLEQWTSSLGHGRERLDQLLSAINEKKMKAIKARKAANAKKEKARKARKAAAKKEKARKARKAANAKKEKARLARLAEEKAKLAALAAERKILKASQPASASVAAAPCNTCNTAPHITMKSTTVVVKHADW